MSNEPMPGANIQDDSSEQIVELSITSETFLQVSDADAALIKGSGRETENPTSDNGCCGSGSRHLN